MKSGKTILNSVICAFFAVSMTIMFSSCKGTKKAAIENYRVAVEFSSDSAYVNIAQQCSFGARVMNTAAHDSCAQWIADNFRSYGTDVTFQDAVLTAFDGTKLRSRNIIARHNPQAERRIVVASHWDSRPWADNDADSTQHRTPVMAANDGASGVAVMIELARLLQGADSVTVGIDFVCFDAEDYGCPYWAKSQLDDEGFALGAAYWAQHLEPNYKADYGILLDMVGGQNARFYQEGVSMYYAQNIVDKVWSAARDAGFGSIFPMENGATVTDDHVPVNQHAQIPMIDIISYYPDCTKSSFGPTWHTTMDDLQHIDKQTLKAVGQTLVQLIWTE